MTARATPGMALENRDAVAASAPVQEGPSATTPDKSRDAAEQRRHPRDPAHDLSQIMLPGSKIGLPCLIHNISRVGALLEVSTSDLPKRFILANYTKRTKTLCRLVWRRDRMIGVEFLTAPRPFDFS